METALSNNLRITKRIRLKFQATDMIWNKETEWTVCDRSEENHDTILFLWHYWKIKCMKWAHNMEFISIHPSAYFISEIAW